MGPGFDPQAGHRNETQVLENQGFAFFLLIVGEFSITIYTLAQTAPGLFAVNIAILTGHKLRGTKGSVVATIASFLPPFIIVLMLCKVYEKWKEYYMFKGIKLHILEELCNLHHLLLKHAPVHEKGHSDG